MNDISKNREALKGDPVEPSLDGNNRASSATSTHATWPESLTVATKVTAEKSNSPHMTRNSADLLLWAIVRHR